MDRDELLRRLNALDPEKAALLLRRLGAQTLAPGGNAPLDRPAPAQAPGLVLSAGQRRMWYLAQYDPASPAYTFVAVYDVRGPLAPDTLEAALRDLFARHDVLRTAFRSVEGEPLATVEDVVAFTLDREEHPNLDEAAQRACVARAAANESNRAFDLATAPQMRFRLLRFDASHHALVWAVHHVVADGWSTHVLMRDLEAFYRARQAGVPAALAAPLVTYADLARVEQERLSSGALDASMAYWSKKLAAPRAILDLPLDHPRPKVRAHHGARLTRPLGHSLMRAVVDLAAKSGTTPFMVLLAGFYALLHRYTGQTDLLVGSLASGRTDPRAETVVGFFANTIVLRERVEGDMTFTALLRAVRETTLEALDHQDLPFDKVVELLRPERATTHNPLFQVMFALLNTPLAEPALSDLTIAPIEADLATSRFDLTLYVRPMPEGLVTSIVYSTELFEAETIERMMGHYYRLLEAAALAPEQRIGALPLLDASERRAVTVTWNDTRRDWPLDAPLHDLVARYVRERPDHPALVVDGGETVTFGELDRRARRLAHALRRRGIGRDKVVGMFLERSAASVVTVLATLLAGGAFLPLDPEYPDDRVAAMIDDASCGAIVTSAALGARLPDRLRSGALVVTPAGEVAGELEGTEEPLPSVGPGDLAYVLYTSGSTGRPKGVMIEHHAIRNRMMWMAEVLALGAADRVLHKTPLVFDIAIAELMLPLVTGATMVIARPDAQRDPRYLLDVIARERVAFVYLVPSTLRMLLENDLGRCRSTLRHVWCGGEVLTPELQERVFELLDARLYNGYGPTEATIGVTRWTCERERARTRATTPIGRPNTNCRVYIVDGDLEVVPIGVPGEIVIGGEQLARGYLGDAALTARRFVTCRLGRIYRTGDRGRWLADGNLEFLGRVDHQVKVRGHRVELEEVEATLLRHPSVRHAAVILREQDGATVLAAYVVTTPSSDGTELDGRAIRAHVAAALPEYMVPTHVERLDALPVTTTGKVDRAALGGRPLVVVREPQIVGPRSALEERIARVWCEVLGRSAVDLQENFFDAGGHSLQLVRVAYRIGAELSREVSVIDVFHHPTIAALARFLEQRPKDDGDPPSRDDARARARAEKSREAVRAGRRRAG